MKTQSILKHPVLLALASLLVLAGPRLNAFPVITNIIETGGDNEATDTVPAKWTGVTFVGGIANEPVPGLAAGASYTVGLFGNHAPAYVDRNHRYTNASTAGAALQVPLPPYLVGREYIMSGNDNRDNNPGYRLDVFVNQPVVVYMLIDNRLGDPESSNADPPSFGPTRMQWILDEGWIAVTNGINRAQNINVPDEVGIDESADNTHNQWFSVYRKLVSTGSFQLKQADNTGLNMYGVVVAPASPPPVPADLTGVAGDGKATLYWSPSVGATAYIIKRSFSPGGPYDNIATNGSATTYADTGLVNGVIHYYVVSALGSGGESANSAEVAVTPRPAPANLVATGGTNQVRLTWNPFAGAASYTVQRADTNGGPYVTIASGILATTYLDTIVQSGRTYYYVIFAQLSAGGNSGVSDQAAGTTAPATPTGLTASLFAATAIRLNWTLSTQVVAQFSLERSVDNVDFTEVATPAGNLRRYEDGGLDPSTTYFYRIRALNAGGSSDYSNVASHTTPAAGWNVNFANTNFTTGAAGYPIAGYVDDYGWEFGDRGNGYFYGWDTNNVNHGRVRNAANSPDKRYDTFNHKQKPTGANDLPPFGRTWSMDIPNGFYWVHIVSGDATAIDSVFQHNINGVITPIKAAGTGTNWHEFTNTAIVSDGRLSIHNGPLASNNKINFIDVYPAEAIPVAIDQQPQTQTVTENRPTQISVTVTNVPFTPTTPFYGVEPIVYQWYQNDMPVARGTNATLDFPLAQTGESGNYFVVVSNYAGSVTSQVVTVTVNEDNTPPQVVSVGSADGYSVGVCFNELLDQEPDPLSNTALDEVNYYINGDNQAVTNAIMRPDGRSVHLQLRDRISGPFTVTVESVYDAARRVPGGGTASATALGLTGQDVGAPLAAGSHYTCHPNVIEIVGAGGDIWGTSDQMHLLSRAVTGDFDVKVRVESLSLPATTGPATIAKAALIARETTDGASRGLHISVNPPPPGRNQGEAGQRPTTSGNTVAWHTGTFAANMPNAWMRITRAGNLFTGYRSSNGVDWIQFAQTNQSYPATMVLGLGVTGHTNAALVATGVFSNFMLTQPAADLGITKMDTPDPFALGAQGPTNLTYTLTVTNQGPDNATATMTDILPAGVTFVSATPSQGSCGNVAGTVTCNLGSLSSGASATITLIVRPTIAGSLTNTATVVAGANDANTANNSATAITRVLATTTVTNLSYSGGAFTMSFATANGLTYHVEYKNALNDPSWTPLTMVSGNGAMQTITDPGPAQPTRFYRIRVE